MAMQAILKTVEVFEQIVSTIVCVMAIYVALFKRKELFSIYKSMLGFLNQVSYVELRVKISKLEDLDVKGEREDIMIILSEIQGQIKVNPLLFSIAGNQYARMEAFTSGAEKLTGRAKAHLIGELKEVLRTIPAEPFKNGNNQNE